MTDDKIVKDIQELYKSKQNFLIVQRTIGIFTILLECGWNTKTLYYRMRQNGVKDTELGIAMAVSLSRIDPKHLCIIDKEVREKSIETAKTMIADYEKLEKESED